MMQDAELQAVVNPELYADEKLLWAGKPAPIYILRQNSEVIATIAFLALLLVGYLYSWNSFALISVSIGNYRVPILSLLLIPVALLLLYAAYFYWRAKQIVYAVTDQRALIIKFTLDGKSVLAYNIIPYIERRIRASGKDDLIFASETHTPFLRMNFRGNLAGSYRYHIRKIGFFGIENAHEVEQLMVKTFRPKRAGNST